MVPRAPSPDTRSPPASETLRGFPPFDRLEPDALAFLDSRLRPDRFPAESVLLSPEDGEPQAMFIIAKGRVQSAQAGSAASAAANGLTLSSGECFPVGALSGRRASANVYSAITDVEAYLLPAPDFHRLIEISQVFSRYCSDYLANLVSQSRYQLQARFAQQADEHGSLASPLHRLVKRAPVAVEASATIGRAIEIMGELKIGSIAIVDAAGAPLGLLTQSDVVQRVVLGRLPLERPIAAAMTPEPATLPETASAYDAMFAMASRGIRHLLLVDAAGRLSGVISERDLFAMQRVGLGQVRRAIAAAQDVEAVRLALRDVRQAAFNMLAQGVGAEQVTQFISALNDAATTRVIELSLVRHDLRNIDWAWLAFGSEGREEQTLATDQDNGIVFAAPRSGDAEPLRQRLLAFAQEVNADLDRCGFPLCKGNIMAGNPDWCLSVDGWKARFSSWIRSPHPEALLNATIFFDFRPLYGNRQLADRMHEHLFGLSVPDSAFQKMLAVNALTVAPPLGLIRDFVTESDEAGETFIDLKKAGARLFVDVARVLALANGIGAASTVARLRQSARLPGGVGKDVEAAVDAFNFVQLLRLRHQHLETGQGRPGDNRVFVERLNQLDRRILKEAFRQARKLQQRLKLDYQI